MKTLIGLSLIYIVGGTSGWFIELIFRRIVHKRWINPGFLVGPDLPLYGIGLVVLYLMCRADYSFIPSPFWQTVFLILIITASMTLIEYLTGLYFIKREKVKLWDYSERWGNVDGIICPLFSFFWGLIGTGYYLLLHGTMCRAVAWAVANPDFSYFIGAYFGVLAVDVCYSFGVVGKIRAFAKEQKLIVRYEEFKNFIRQKTKALGGKSSFILSFKTGSKPLWEVLEHYRDEMAQKREFRREIRAEKKENQTK